MGEGESPHNARIGGRVLSRIEEYVEIPLLSHRNLNRGLVTLGALGVGSGQCVFGDSLKLEMMTSWEEVTKGLSFLQMISMSLSECLVDEIKTSSWLSLEPFPVK